jgi:hypothetical protein
MFANNLQHILYINSLRPSVCLTGVLGGGGGRGRWSSGRLVSVCDGGWTTTVSMYKLSPQSIAAVQRVGMTVGSHPSPTAPEADILRFGGIKSQTHRTIGGFKNLPPPPPPPTIEITGGYIEERVFRNFQNFRKPRFKMLEPGFWVFSRWVRE